MYGENENEREITRSPDGPVMSGMDGQVMKIESTSKINSELGRITCLLSGNARGQRLMHAYAKECRSNGYHRLLAIQC